MFSQIGIARAASLMNLVAITAALSSFNSGVYSTARMLYNLGKQGNAPSVTTNLSHQGVPFVAIYFSLLCILLTVVLNYLYPKQIFNILLAIATIAGIINWIFILITQMCFRKKTHTLHYKLPFFPATSIVAIIFFILSIFF